MQKRTSVFEFIQITLTQIVASRKRLTVVAAAMALVVSCAVWSGHSETLAKTWAAGWQAWMRDDYETALTEWSKGKLFADFGLRPARRIYWRARALEQLGRDKEAAALKAEIARKYPLDYYAFLLFPDGGASAHPDGECIKIAAVFHPRPWRQEVEAAAAKTGISEELAWAVMRQESKFRRTATSPAGAVGLMQLMPLTAAEIAKRLNISEDETDLNLPRQNILLGCSYMMRLVARFRDELPKAVAAYNAGASNIIKWDVLSARDWVEWIEEIPYAQTREYVRSVLENREIYIMLGGGDNSDGLMRISSLPLIPLKSNVVAQGGKEEEEIENW